jgi:Tol biopolymer transport system component
MVDRKGEKFWEIPNWGIADHGKPAQLDPRTNMQRGRPKAILQARIRIGNFLRYAWLDSMSREKAQERSATSSSSQSGTHGVAETSPALSPQMILEELDRILASREFSQAPRLRQFLRFTVEETLAGRSEALKEYTIGVRVYDRGEGFDPRSDPIVRVQAGKLRGRLSSFYASGSFSPVRIELPKGTYVPVFRENQPQQPAEHGWSRSRLRALAPLAVATVAAVLLVYRRVEPRSVRAPSPWRLTFDTGWTANPAISRDGFLMAFESDRPDGVNKDIWVRDLRSGGLRRLTTHPAIDSYPDFSPDGARIVFRSFRDGGGVYIVPVAGGPEKLLAPGGFSPRFSPDGRWVAYAAVEQSGNMSIYVVPAEGGSSRRIHPHNISSMCPVWTPDGSGLIFRASETEAKRDWWIARFDPANPAPVSTRLLKVEGQGPDIGACPGVWLGDEMFFAKSGAVYRISFSTTDWSPQSAGRLVLPGPGIEGESVSVRSRPGGGRSLVFSQGESMNHLWAVPVGERGDAGVDPRQLTHDASVQNVCSGGGMSLSRDGRFLVFPTWSAAPGRRILFRDLETGKDSLLSPGTQTASDPVLTPDGQAVAWLVERDGKRGIFAAGTGGGDVREVCADCGVPRAWSPDGSILLYTDGVGLWSLAVPSGDRTCLLKRGGLEVYDGGLSPDGRWVALVVGIAGKPKLQGVLAPFDHLADEQRWISVVEEDYSLTLKWAARGDAVFYLSRRDDFRCLYRQRLRASDNQPVGPPMGIRHFHSSQNYPGGGSPIAVAHDKVVLALGVWRANIWEIDLPE